MEPSTSSATAHHASTSPTPSLATNASSTPSLPTEVVSHIVAYATDDLSYTERQSARMRMSLVSRSWYHMMADELNKECVVTESNADRLVEALASKDSEQPIAITGLVLREGKKKKPPPPPPPRREPTPDFGDDDIIIIDPATVEPPKPPPPPPPRPQTQESFALLLTLLSGLKSLTFEAKLDYSTCFDTPNTRFFNALKTLASLQRFVLLEPTQHRLDRCDLKSLVASWPQLVQLHIPTLTFNSAASDPSPNTGSHESLEEITFPRGALEWLADFPAVPRLRLLNLAMLYGGASASLERILLPAAGSLISLVMPKHYRSNSDAIIIGDHFHFVFESFAVLRNLTLPFSVIDPTIILLSLSKIKSLKRVEILNNTNGSVYAGPSIPFVDFERFVNDVRGLEHFALPRGSVERWWDWDEVVAKSVAQRAGVTLVLS